MDAVKELKTSVIAYADFNGEDIRDFLKAEGERLEKLDILVDDSARLQPHLYEKDDALKARWLLGQLRHVAEEKASGLQIISVMNIWESFAIDIIEKAS